MSAHWTVDNLIAEVRCRWFGGDSDVWIALALAGEVGEVCNLIKKENRKTAPAPRFLQEQVAEELVDVLFYVARLLDARGIDLQAAWRLKMAENDRKYGRVPPKPAAE